LKTNISSDDQKFLLDIPWNVALVSTADEKGVGDICPVDACE
jgi:hypothetical protein